jgi:RNA polymerase sigma factor (sigma-70 family)
MDFTRPLRDEDFLDLEDEDLIALYRLLHSQPALEELLARGAKRGKRVIARRARHWPFGTDLDDAGQVVFLGYWRAIGGFKLEQLLRPNRCRFHSYAGLFIGASLYDFEKQIERHEGHVDRRTNPASELDLEAAELYEACQDWPEWTRGQDDPARQAAVHELFELVQGIAHEMGERTTSILEHFLCGKSLREIARLMDLPEGAVKGRWQRLLIEARRRLRV